MVKCNDCGEFIPTDITCPDCGGEPPVVQVVFQVGDLDFKEDWTEEKKARFLREKKRAIEDILCRRGNEALSDMACLWERGH